MYKMPKMSKTIKMLVLFCTVFLVFSLVLIISMVGGANLSIFNTVPLTGAPQIILLFAFLCLGAAGGAFLGSFLAKLFLTLHKKFVGKELNYSLQEIDAPIKDIKLINALYPALFGISVAISLAANSTVQAIILPPAVTADNLTPDFKTFLGLLPLTVFLGMLIPLSFKRVCGNWSNFGILFISKRIVDRSF